MAVKLRIENNDELVIEEGDGDLIAEMIKGCEGKLTIRNPRIKGGKIEVKKIKDKDGKVLKDKTKKEK